MAAILALYMWMPLELQLLVGGVFILFSLITLLHLVKFILDLIPFV